MNRTEKSRSSLFLIELILAILFFALGSGICVQVFVRASLISKEAADLSFASSQASSAASVIRYSSDPGEYAETFFPGARTEDSGFCVFYDDSRQICTAEEAAYTMEVSVSESDGLCIGSITVTGSDNEVIYELETHYPAVTKEENTP